MAVSQRVVAGVSIDECLSVGAYGAVHKAHTASRRDLRALLVDAKLATDTSFAAALLDDKVKGALTSFDHPSIVPTLSIARTGEELVVVTVGPGRHTTVADLLAGSSGGKGGKLPVELAGAIAQAVVQALAAAHQRGLVHGAVHARSVAIDDAGHVKVCDFAAGRALTEAVARGADPSLLRGLTGSLPPEVALGDPPSAAGDVFAAGALLFTMLTGEAPPGSLRVTPAVERVVQLSLDTDPARRFRDGTELLEALLEAYDDDRWTIADAVELRKLVLGRSPAGAPIDGNLDDDTEDLLASLGNAAKNVALTRPSIDIRAAAVAERQKTGTGKSGLDALLADLDPKEELTAVDEPVPRRDPISEIIRLDHVPRPPSPSKSAPVKPKTESTTVSEGRALDDRDNTPLPAPSVGDDSGLLPVRGKSKQRSGAPTVPAKPQRSSSSVSDDGARPKKQDEIAALSAIAGLDGLDAGGGGDGGDDDEAAVEAATAPAPKVRAKPAPAPEPKPAAPVVRRARPVSAIDPQLDDAGPNIRLKSRFWPIVWTVLILGGGGAAVYAFMQQKEGISANEKAKQEQQKKNEELEHRLREEQVDPGAIKIRSEPPEATVWLLIGRTPTDSIGLPSSMLHQLRVELQGYTHVDTQVPGSNWTGDNAEARVANLSVTLTPQVAGKDGKMPPPPPFQPPVVPEAIARGPFPPGRGILHIESEPRGAEVWLWVGTTNTMELSNVPAGKDYELKVLKDGYLPGFIRIAGEEWRDGGDPKLPINSAPKHSSLERSVTLALDPNAPKDPKAPRR
jgi:serine/threonine protein kinase